MTNFTVQVKDQQINQLLAQLEAKKGDLKPALQDIGEALKIQIDRCFATQTGPDGQRWQSNALSTIENYLKARGGYTKKGALSKRGEQLLSSKKVLQGITGELRRSIYWHSTQTALTVGSPKRYAAIHQFGGPFKAWGKTSLTMPTRPFMPIDKDGNLYPKAKDAIVNRLKQHLSLK